MQKAITQNKRREAKTRFSRLLQHPAWKQSGGLLPKKKIKEK